MIKSSNHSKPLWTERKGAVSLRLCELSQVWILYQAKPPNQPNTMPIWVRALNWLVLINLTYLGSIHTSKNIYPEDLYHYIKPLF